MRGMNGDSASPGRRFSVVIPGDDKKSMFLSQLEVGADGLKLWNILGDDVLNDYKFDQIDSWWFTEDQFFILVNTPEGEKEVKLKSKKSEEIINAMQACVDNILKKRQSLIEHKEQVSNAQPGSAMAGMGSTTSQSTEVKRGYLSKQRNKFPYRWQKRFFVLAQESGGHVLKYYASDPADKEDEKSLGAIDLAKMKILPYKDNPRLCITFEAWQANKNRQRQFVLQAEEEWAAEAWTQALLTVATVDNQRRTSLMDDGHDGDESGR